MRFSAYILGTLLFITSVAEASVSRDVRSGFEEAVRSLVDTDAVVEFSNWNVPQRDVMRRARTVRSVELLGRSRPYGQVTGRARLQMRNGQQRQIFVTATVDVQVPVWVTTQRIARNESLNSMNLSVEHRPMGRIPANAIRADQSIEDLVSARPLSPGRVLTDRTATTPVLVQRGEDVSVVVQVGNVMIRTHGEALQSGRQGDRVSIRLNSSRRTLRGRVDGSNRVRIVQ
jgi:flagella basal body P-ring formation protein FlgA